MDWLMDLLFSPWGLKALQWLGGVGGTLLGIYVIARINSPWVKALLGRLLDEAKATAKDVYDAWHKQYALAKADGVVTPEEELEARQAAFDAAKLHFRGKLGLAHLVKIVLGISLDSWLKGKVDEHLDKAKKAGEDAVKANPSKGLSEVLDIKEIK